MADSLETAAALSSAEVGLLASAVAAPDARRAVFAAVESVALGRMGCSVFSASTCVLATLELDRIHSSRPDIYPTGLRKSKRETNWARQVLQQGRVFVGEGPLEMAAAFDDQERMAALGIRSIVNVPVVVRERCLGVLNFGWNVERVSPPAVLIARLLGLAATAAFVVE